MMPTLNGTVAAAIFGVWQSVTPLTMLQPVPEWVETSTHYAKPVEKGYKALPDACALRDEAGKVVGYRTACERGE